MLKKGNKKPRQKILLIDENDSIVSVADTLNGWETAIRYKWKWIIKVGDHSEKIKNCKTIEEAIDAMSKVNDEYSQWSESTFEEIMI